MTTTPSLSERLRELGYMELKDVHVLAREAADALDAKDKEIERLLADAKDEREDWQAQVAGWKDKADRRADALDAKDKEIARLQADKEAMVKLACSYDDDNDKYRALLAQAEAALQVGLIYIQALEKHLDPTIDPAAPTIREHGATMREALAALRANGVP